MSDAMTLAFAAAVPFLCLGLLMWLARLEETLTDGLESPTATREPAAAPAVAVATATEAAPATVAAA